MAKKRTQRGPTANPALSALSAKVRRAVEAIRRPFNAFVDDLRLVNESRSELAPKFMKAFGMWQSEIGGTFVDFCRVLVPEIGIGRNEYRAHPAYQAADYLRRLAAQGDRQTQTPQQRAERLAAAPETPTNAVARLIKTIVPMIRPEQTQVIWDALRTQLHWTDRLVNRIQNETQRVEPLVILREPRGLNAIGHLRLTVPVATEESELAATGT